MSVEATSFVWQTANQKSTGLLMLLALADYANELGECWPGIEALAQKARVKVRNAQTILKKLASQGAIEIQYNQGTQTGTGKTNRYKLIGFADWLKRVQGVQPTAPLTAEAVQQNAPLKGEGVQSSVTRGASLRTQGVQRTAPDPSLEPSKNPSVDTLKQPKPKKARDAPKPWSALTKALHEATPEDIRPVRCNYAKNDKPARALYEAGYTPGRITSFVNANYPGYRRWAEENDAQIVMSMHYVCNQIKGWEAKQNANGTLRQPTGQDQGVEKPDAGSESAVAARAPDLALAQSRRAAETRSLSDLLRPAVGDARRTR